MEVGTEMTGALTLVRELADALKGLDSKAVRHVRTEAGVRHYQQPIGSVIVRDGNAPLSNLFSVDSDAWPGWERVRDSEGNGYWIGRYDGEDDYVAVDDNDNVVASSGSEEDTYVQLDSSVPQWVETAEPKKIGVQGMHAASPGEREEVGKRLGKAIPPAWTDVHIADDLDNDKVLVKGKDAKGRWQTIYSAAHTEGQAEAKFKRNKELSEHLDKLDDALARDALDDDSAAALLLIRRLGMRPGSNSNTGADVQAHGATNLLARHARITPGGQLVLDFTGKKGVHIVLRTRDPEIVAAVRARLDAGRSGNDPLFRTNETRVRDYMRTTGGVPQEFLLKDLRTMHANVTALREVERRGNRTPSSQAEFRRWRREVAVVVSNELGNTPTLALNSYIDPVAFARWQVDPSWS
jgi:DNA topoisomerase I